jgi:antitoxin ParD1/3/4
MKETKRGCEFSSSDQIGSSKSIVRELIREDEKRKAEERFEALLLEGIQSEETPLIPQDWVDIRKEAMARIKRRKKQNRRA